MDDKRDFEEWYSEIVKRGFFEKYTMKDIIKIAWVVGGDNFSEKDNISVSYQEEDEDLIISYEFFGNDFEKNNPELLKPIAKIEDRIPEQEILELKEKYAEKIKDVIQLQ